MRPLSALAFALPFLVPDLARATDPTLEAVLVPSNASQGQGFGRSVAAWSETVAIGTEDGVHVYARDGTTWHEEAILVGPTSSTVAIAGETIVAGSPGDPAAGPPGSGAAYVFVRAGTLWSLQSVLTASDAATGDALGTSVAIDGDTAVVGAPEDDHAGGANAGSVYVFQRAGTLWAQRAKLVAGDGAPGDRFGVDVALDGDLLVVGADRDDDAGLDSGSAYVFARQGTAWLQEAKLRPPDLLAGDRFGASVALANETAVVGAPFDDDGAPDAGSAHVFERGLQGWTREVKLVPPVPEAFAELGHDVDVQDDGPT